MARNSAIRIIQIAAALAKVSTRYSAEWMGLFEVITRNAPNTVIAANT